MDREPAKRFEELIVWQKAHQLVLRIYKLTMEFPKHETYGLMSQMRRAAVSVPANIAEGFKKRGRPDKARVLKDLGYLPAKPDVNDVQEVARMLGAYTATVQSPST